VTPPVALTLALPRSTVDPAEADGTLRDVLRDPAFTAAERSWLQQLREDIQRWFLERLAEVFSSDAGTVIAWVLVAVAVLIGVLVVWRATRGMQRGARSDDEPTTEVTATRPPSAWLDDARAAERAGNHAEAVRCGYRAVVALLARRGHLEEVPGRTVGEYRAQVAEAGPDRLSDFTRASDVFERVWYARRPATPDDVGVVVGVADDLAGAR
jgi:hypothetical protein